jgi:heme/copper-type cytochrome/quinol oxidase subunit 3
MWKPEVGTLGAGTVSTGHVVPHAGQAGAAGKTALWLLVGSEIIIFGGAVASFVLMRWSHPEWAQEAAHLNFWAGAFNTLVLLTSSFTMALAVAGMRRVDRMAVGRNLFFTLVLGLVFLLVKGSEYSAKFHHGIYPSTSTYWSFYFLMTGLHGLHVVAGLVTLGTFFILDAADSLVPVWHRVEAAGLYWHLIDIIWIFLFPLLYLS